MKKFYPQTCFLGCTKLRSGRRLPTIAPSSPLGQENWGAATQYKNSNRKHVFWKNEFDRAFEAKFNKVFVRNNFAPERSIQLIKPIKEVWGRFHQKIPIENMFFRIDETSLRETFAPNRAIQSVWPIKQVRCDLVQKFKPKMCFWEKRIPEGFSGKIEQSFRREQFCPRTHHIANQAQKRGIQLVSSKNSNRKRIFWGGRSFTPGHFCPQLCHLVR